MTTIAPEQLTLNLTPLREPIYETGMTLAERFEAFHAANPRDRALRAALTANPVPTWRP